MFIKRLLPCITALAITGGLMIGGCDGPVAKGVLVTGTVDTVKMLQYDEEYQSLARDYYKERVLLASQLEKVVQENGGVIKDKDTYERFAKLDKELNEKWLKKTREYTEKKLVSVKGACESVCKSKGIDIVLLDSQDYATVEYGGVDISADVFGELPGFAGGSASPDANASAATSPEAGASPAAGAQK